MKITTVAVCDFLLFGLNWLHSISAQLYVIAAGGLGLLLALDMAVIMIQERWTCLCLCHCDL